MAFTHANYLNYAELTRQLQFFAKTYPDLARLDSIGTSLQGREIWLMTVTDFSSHAAHERPALWIDGNTHASELAGCQACLHLIETLLTEAASRDSLSRTTYYIVPRISVDGAEHVLTTGSVIRSSPEIFPGENPPENFAMQDLDGDGEILMMRVEDEAGRFKISPHDPRLMVGREPTDSVGPNSKYYSLYPEGIFKNYDGMTRRFLNPQRFDLNRQAPADFSPREAGAGPIPLYLPEAKALALAVMERTNIVAAITYHTYGGFLLRPSSVRADSEMPAKDLEIYKIMGRVGQKITGYPPLAVFHDFKYDASQPTTGAWDDWQYEHRGIFAWTPEIWSLPAAAGVKLETALQMYGDLGAENLWTVLKWCDANLEPGSYLKEWQHFDHPQLGRVEIGGWRTLFTWRNPPAKFLASELSKLTPFALALAAFLPQIKISVTQVERTHPDVYAIRVQVSNLGYLPTSVSERAISLKIYSAPKAHLTLSPGQRLLQGKAEVYIKHLKGRSEGLPWLSPVVGHDFEGSHQDILTWTVVGNGIVHIEVNYPGAGVLRQSLTLS